MGSSSRELGRFRFRPRYRPLAVGAVLMGALLLAYAIATGESTALAATMGLAGITLGALYLASPVWRFEVVIHEDRLEVERHGSVRFSLPWDRVQELIASPDTRTCFLRGDTPEHSLLVPGPGASASYDIHDKDRLFQLLLERVPSDRVREVESLKAWKKAQAGRMPLENDDERVDDQSDDGGDAGQGGARP